MPVPYYPLSHIHLISYHYLHYHNIRYPNGIGWSSATLQYHQDSLHCYQ